MDKDSCPYCKYWRGTKKWYDSDEALISEEYCTSPDWTEEWCKDSCGGMGTLDSPVFYPLPEAKQPAVLVDLSIAWNK